MRMLVEEQADHVGAREHAGHVLVFHDGNEALALAENDAHGFVQAGVRGQGTDVALHVFGHGLVAELVGHGPAGGLQFQQTDAACFVGGQDGNGL